MIRTVDTQIITENIKEMCIEANHYLSKDMDIAMKQAVETEKSELGKKILNQLQDNLKIDYVKIVDLSTMQQIDTIEHGILAAMAVYIGKTRLIDNFMIED